MLKKKFRKYFFTPLFPMIILYLFFNRCSMAETIIEPNTLLVMPVPLGERTSFEKNSDVALSIHNTSSFSQTYIITVKQPTNNNLLQGYYKIPHAGWIEVEENQINISPRTKEKMNIYITIPTESKYYNQHWEALINIKEKPQKEQLFSTEYDIKCLIETQSKEIIETNKMNSENLIPSIIQFQNVDFDKKTRKNTSIYNNSDNPHKFQITVITPPETIAGSFIPYSFGYEKLPETEWIYVSAPDEKIIERKKNNKQISPIKEIIIQHRKSVKVAIEVNIPDKVEYHNKKWEALLFVFEPDSNETMFSRIQIMTQK